MEDIIIIFKGRLYFIKDSKIKIIKVLNIKDRQVIKEVFIKYKYYIIKV